MINLEFTDAERNLLHYERFHHPHPRVQLKMDVLWLKSQKIPHSEICRLANISGTTLTRYLREYQENGIDGLKTVRFHRPQSDLCRYQGSIESHFRKTPPATVKQAMAAIESMTGVRRSPNRVRVFMRHIGLKCRRVGMIPAKADIEKQEEFKINELEPKLAEAKRGKRVVYFVDSAHFVLAPFLGTLWSFLRIFIPAPAGRQRFNVLGALNAITHELVMVTNDTYINACSVCELICLIASQQLGVPITLILDNARYQKCHLVAEKASALGIELLYLPAYSPNLNLIERLWKFVKKKCLYSKYYDNFTDFKQAIATCLGQTGTSYKRELDSLLTLKFQTFKKSQIMAV